MSNRAQRILLTNESIEGSEKSVVKISHQLLTTKQISLGKFLMISDDMNYTSIRYRKEKALEIQGLKKCLS